MKYYQIKKRKKNRCFTLFSCCKIIKGHGRGLLCDLQRSKYTFIHNDICDLILFINKKPIGEIKKIVGIYGEERVNSLLDFLLANEWGFITDSPDSFPDIPSNWNSYSKITNIIFQIDESVVISADIVYQIEMLGCYSVEIQFTKRSALQQIAFVLELFDSSSVESINLYASYFSSKSNIEFWESIRKKHYRVNNIYIYDSEQFEYKNYANNTIFCYLPYNIDLKKSCGSIHLNSFVLNLPLFTESLHHNSCLNRKISIDIDGNIKNCPSMAQSFGNIKDTTLQEALDHPDFKKYWNVTKDQIAVCKDCEFRYICTDCRAYTENPEDMYAKPLKCGYNPYTCEWEEWSTNPLKQQAIDYYGMREVLPEFKLKPDYVPPYATSPE